MAEETSRTIENLPPETIQHILSKLPINSLFESRCVSPSWHTLIDEDPCFSFLHYTQSVRNGNPTSLLIVCHRSGKSYLHFVLDFDTCEEAVKLNNLPFQSFLQTFSTVGSCNGLLCLAGPRHRYRNIVVCNPMTGNWMRLPDHPVINHQRIFLGFGYSSIRKEYKLIRMGVNRTLGNDGVPGSSTVDVVTVGRNSWRSIGTIRWNISRVQKTTAKFKQSFGVFVNGCLHWLDVDDSHVVVAIRAFHVEDEKFLMIPVPDSIDGNITRGLLYLGVLRGCLMIADYSIKGTLQVWMMKKYGVKESWNLEFVIQAPASYGILRPLGEQRNGNILLEVGEVDCRALFSYDPKNLTLERLRVSGLPRVFRAVPHVGTIVPMKNVIPAEGL